MRCRLFPRGLYLAITAALLLGLVACASWWDSESDLVRSAVVAHELDESGLYVDDLIIRLSPGAVRADFGHGSRMVWLVSSGWERRYREGEYFRLRDPERSYLFLHEIRYDDSRTRAEVTAVLYTATSGAVTKEISLSKTAAGWKVSSERPVEDA